MRVMKQPSMPNISGQRLVESAKLADKRIALAKKLKRFR